MSPTAEAISKSFDFAAEVVKQLITLSTAIIAVMITFSKDIVGVVARRGIRQLRASWTLYLCSMVAGVLALGAMTGSLAKNSAPDIYQPNIVVWTVLQWLLFLSATAVLIVYSGHLLKGHARQAGADDGEQPSAKKGGAAKAAKGAG